FQAEDGIRVATVTGVQTCALPIFQPGSYVFMDADYNRNVWEDGWPRFEQSLFVLATVMSTPASDRAVLDAGLKASSVDSGLPQRSEERRGRERVWVETGAGSR